MAKFRRSCVFLVLCLLLVLFSPTVTRAQPAAVPARTLAPTFVVYGEPMVDRLEVKSTAVAVHIAGVMADVTVTQRYRSEGGRDIEARYVFVGSGRAAVHAVQMRLGDRLILRDAVAAETRRGHGAGTRRSGELARLSEQYRPIAFRSDALRIRPGEEVAVELRYTELLVRTDGKYRFVYPTATGSRYDASTESGFGAAERWVAVPFPSSRRGPSGSFDLKLTLDSAIPLGEVESRTHRLDIRYEGAKRAVVSLSAAGGKHDDRAFVLDYRLSGDRAGVSALLRKDSGEPAVRVAC